MCTREFRARRRARDANRRTAAEADLPPRAASGAGRFRAGDRVTINGAHYRVTGVDAASGTVRGVPTDWNGPEQTIRERNAREREAMDAATINREDPEAALAARQEGRREEAAPTLAEARRVQQEADAVIERVRGMEFTTSDGVAIHGGRVSFADANYGIGHGGNPEGGANCYANAEAMEARLVYGLDVYPFGPTSRENFSEPNYRESAERAKRDGEFIPFDRTKSGGENCTNAIRALMDAPNGTFMRVIGTGHTTGIYKRNDRLYKVDGYAGRLDELGAPTPANLGSFVEFTRREYYSSNGWVLLPPSERRLRSLMRSRFVVGSIGNSGVYSRNQRRLP